MFRNPRENAAVASAAAVLPSTGRPPTPPPHDATKQSPYFPPAPSQSSKNTASPVSYVPIVGRQPQSKISSVKRNATRQNQTILNFFGKADKDANTIVDNDAGLFFADGSKAKILPVQESPLPLSQDDNFRYNEDVTPVKRQRTEVYDHNLSPRTPPPDLSRHNSAASSTRVPNDATEKKRRNRGGFVDDSSDEEDAVDIPIRNEAETTPTFDKIDDNNVEEVTVTTKVPLKPADHGTTVKTPLRRMNSAVSDTVPTLGREATSMAAPEEFGDDDFEDDEFFSEGEEFLERRWMQEQRDMEAEFEDDSKSEPGLDSPRTPSSMTAADNVADGTDPGVSSCPMCGGSTKGLSDIQISTHVNACLDGTAQPLPSTIVKTETSPQNNGFQKASSLLSQAPAAGKSRFQRSAVARPAQANPFSMANGSSPQGSAFNRLMSGHAEDAAWAEAAANELQSRGKPAYARTCPFYKIMPGLYICVDAFRYGKVEGQNAYFLSHFHSDHYIGLTSSWCHGPIYASKVSCNLMRQQLKVDSKWLCPLEFDKKTEVPNTKGVFVTMIPANHCPGSSLFLFEKELGKNKDGSPKLNRILHCGDFRACPAHVHHPLLRPDVMDSVTGVNRQQIIDTCYLDTTYLTPKFSFPSQYDVIDACAQMAVSLAKEIPDDNDSWEKVKMAKAGSVMTNFLEEGKSEIIKKEEAETEDKKPKLRGRLLVVIGTYSIGKERICMGIARALGSKIYAPPAKMRICKALEDPELNALLTSDPLAAQVHMQTLMEIRAETLHDYLITFRGHFHRVVGFRPTGWTYRPPSSRFTDNPTVTNVLHSEGWKSRFTMRDLAPQRGSTKAANCFGVPYSEHSSFRELTMFCCALRINRVIPTVNVGNARSRERMKGWIEKWDAEKKKNGLYQVEVGEQGWGSGNGQLMYGAS